MFATREQILAIVARAQRTGRQAFALGLLIQWTFCLRGVDVFGQWEPATGKGGIVRNGLRWIDGLTWDMIDADLAGFSKVISKTRRAMPEAMRHDLTAAPTVRSLLAQTEAKRRIGPVIVAERTGLPYTVSGRSGLFKELLRDLDLPDDLTMMDTRAGALPEAQRLGADALTLRDAAGHLDVATTNRYRRGRDDSIARVVKLRG